MWAAHAVDTSLIEKLTDADIADGLDAAAAVGDDRIQQARDRARSTGSRGRTARPGSARSGSPTGYRTGDPTACDTFAADAL